MHHNKFRVLDYKLRQIQVPKNNILKVYDLDDTQRDVQGPKIHPETC